MSESFDKMDYKSQWSNNSRFVSISTVNNEDLLFMLGDEEKNLRKSTE